MLHKSGLSWGAWLALAPELARLVAEVVTALKDGKISPTEVQQIGQDFVGLVVHAMA